MSHPQRVRSRIFMDRDGTRLVLRNKLGDGGTVEQGHIVTTPDTVTYLQGTRPSFTALREMSHPQRVKNRIFIYGPQRNSSCTKKTQGDRSIVEQRHIGTTPDANTFKASVPHLQHLEKCLTPRE